MAMTTPSPNSFRRIKPKFWSGAYRVWGIDNKEAAIRVLHNPYGAGPERFEFKTADLTANPYIALSGIISSGADGINKGLKLPSPIQRDPANFNKQEQKKLGIERLPETVSSALEEQTQAILRTAIETQIQEFPKKLSNRLKNEPLLTRAVDKEDIY